MPIDLYFKDTKAMMIQRLRTQRYCGFIAPLPRQISKQPLYFKTHYRANRESDIIKINPTQYHSQCIIQHFLGIPTYSISTRHNILSRTLLKILFTDDIRGGTDNTDRWDSSDMIQRLMTRKNLLRILITKNIIYIYENKQNGRRQIQGQRKCLTLKGAD